MGKHALERTQQRYNMELSYNDEENIKAMIRNGRAIHIDEETGDEDKHFAYVVYNNIPIKVLYANWELTSKLKCIVTVYPLDVDEYNKAVEGSFNDRLELTKLFLESNKYTVSKKNDKNTDREMITYKALNKYVTMLDDIKYFCKSKDETNKTAQQILKMIGET